MRGKYQNNSDIVASCYRPPCADRVHRANRSGCGVVPTKLRDAPHPRYFLFRAYVSSIAGQGLFLRRRWLRVRCAPACNKERANAVIQPNSCVVAGNRPSTLPQVRDHDGARTYCTPYTGLRYAHLRVPGLRSFGKLGGAFRRCWLEYLRGLRGFFSSTHFSRHAVAVVSAEQISCYV
jgi:hypothetical protein